MKKKSRVEHGVSFMWRLPYNGSVPWSRLMLVHEGDYVEVNFENIKLQIHLFMNILTLHGIYSANLVAEKFNLHVATRSASSGNFAGKAHKQGVHIYNCALQAELLHSPWLLGNMAR